MAEYIGADLTSLPSLILFSPENGGKFKYETSVTSENLIKFVDDFNNNKLVRHLKSADP